MEKEASLILEELKKSVHGKDKILKKVLMSMLAQGHILLDDVPGVGKTTMALSFSRVLDLSFKRIQFTPDVTPSDVVGFTMYDSGKQEFVFKPGVVMSNLILADEINRTSSKTQSALLEVMEEKQVTVDGHTYPVPSPFIVIGTQNPVGSAGTQMLPHSQLDRFMICLDIGYPSKSSLVDILKERQGEHPLEDLDQVISQRGLIRLQEKVRKLKISEAVLVYIADLCEASRCHDLVELGLSPRGAIAMMKMAKAHAFVEGKSYVSADDVVAIFTDVSAHRLMLKNKARVAGKTQREVADDILGKVKPPLMKRTVRHG